MKEVQKNTNGTIRLVGVVLAFLLALSTAVYAVAEVSTRVGGLERRMANRERREEVRDKDIAEIKTNVGILLERTRER